jgi:hypothetical protein
VDPGFGGQRDDSIKARLVNLVSSVRTLMRCTYPQPSTDHRFHEQTQLRVVLQNPAVPNSAGIDGQNIALQHTAHKQTANLLTRTQYPSCLSTLQ